MEPRTTLRDIAKAAHVHVTTVSLALRNHPRIPEATRLRIQKLAETLHYRPDAALSALMVYRQSRRSSQNATPIAFLTGDKTRDYWKSEPSLRQIHHAVIARAEERGYRMEEFWLHEPGVSPRRLNQLLLARGIEAILIAPWIRGRAHLRFGWERFHCVKIGHTLVYPATHTVETNHYQCMQLAMRTLRSKGYRRIGFTIRTMEDERLNHLYRAAYLVERERFALPDQIPAFVPNTWDMKLFKDWVRDYRPDAIISPDWEVADWIKKMRVRIPQDIGYANLDCRDADAGQSGIHQRHDEVGRTAIDLLISLIHRNERGVPSCPHLTQVAGRWVDGSSTR